MKTLGSGGFIRATQARKIKSGRKNEIASRGGANTINNDSRYGRSSPKLRGGRKGDMEMGKENQWGEHMRERERERERERGEMTIG